MHAHQLQFQSMPAPGKHAPAPTCLLGNGFALCPYFLLDPIRAALLTSLRMDTKSSKYCLPDQKVELPLSFSAAHSGTP